MRLTSIITSAALLCSISATRVCAGEFSLGLTQTNQFRRPNYAGALLTIVAGEIRFGESRLRIEQPWGKERQDGLMFSTRINRYDADVRAAVRTSSDESKGTLASVGLTQDMGGWILDAHATGGNADLAVARVGGTYLDLDDTDTYTLAGFVAMNATRDTIRRPEELLRPLAGELLGIPTLAHTLPDEETPASMLAGVEVGYADDRVKAAVTLSGGTIAGYNYEDTFKEVGVAFARDGKRNDTRLETTIRRLDENTTTGAEASYSLSFLAEHSADTKRFEAGIGSYLDGSGTTLSHTVQYYDALGAALKAGIKTRAGTFGFIAAFDKSIPEGMTATRAAAYYKTAARSVLLGTRVDEQASCLARRERSVFARYEGPVGPFMIAVTAGIGTKRYGSLLLRYTTNPKGQKHTATEELRRDAR